MRKGFTLLEIIMTIAIVIMIATISINTVTKYAGKQNVHAQERIITADLKYALELAQTTDRDIRIIFDTQKYTITDSDAIKKTLYLNPGFTVSAQVFGYTPQGTPMYSGTLYLSYKKIIQSKLTVALGSGLLKWQNL